MTQIERFEKENSSIDQEIVSNSQKNSFMAMVNCNNFQIGVYLSKALFRFAQIAQLRYKLLFYAKHSWQYSPNNQLPLRSGLKGVTLNFSS